MSLGHDVAVRLWRRGYDALGRERDAHGGGDVFACRLLGRRAVVVRGADGARAFYDEDVVERHGAVPAPLAGLLFGHGAVHGLDGEAHRERKRIFLGVLTPDAVADIAQRVRADLERRAGAWRGRDVALFDELAEAYGTAMVAWAGIDCPPAEARGMARRMAAIVDGFGGAPAAYPKAWVARLRGNRWARRLVQDVRAGRRSAAPGTAVARLAASDLPATVAGVELLNLVRPTVAVAWPATFAALALAQHPEWRERLRHDADQRVAFVHEVRRVYPFAPALAGRARRSAEVGGELLGRGERLVLDIVGTNLDPAAWPDPEAFRPERFARREPDPFAFVPQGGGDPRTGHRCPGEPLTVRLMAETVGVLAAVGYDVFSSPAYDRERIPTRPADGLVIRVSTSEAAGTRRR